MYTYDSNVHTYIHVHVLCIVVSCIPLGPINILYWTLPITADVFSCTCVYRDIAWLLGPGTSSQSEGYDKQMTNNIWLVCGE